MNRIFLTLAIIFSAAIAHADDTFYGKYRMTIGSEAYEVGAEFLVNSKDEVTTLKEINYGSEKWEDTDTKDAVKMNRVPDVSDYAISTEQVTFSYAMGSDEDAVAGYITLAWLITGDSDDDKELVAVSNYSIFTDGPNQIVEVSPGAVTLEKWNTKTKEWEVIGDI